MKMRCCRVRDEQVRQSVTELVSAALARNGEIKIWAGEACGTITLYIGS
jgi:hypothetical protein